MEAEQFRKLFIGGLSYETTEDSLKSYFEKWGNIVDCVVMRDPNTKRSRGFGFVTYDSAESLNEAQANRPHTIDKKEVESKRATPREESGKPEAHMTIKKVFVGGVKDDVEEEHLREYFANYGNVTSVDLIVDKETRRKRGFAFVTFDDYDPVDKLCLEKNHCVNGKRCDVRKAVDKKDLANMPQRGMGGGGRGGRGGGRGGGSGRWNDRGSYNSNFGNQSANYGGSNYGGGNYGGGNYNGGGGGDSWGGSQGGGNWSNNQGSSNWGNQGNSNNWGNNQGGNFDNYGGGNQNQWGNNNNNYGGGNQQSSGYGNDSGYNSGGGGGGGGPMKGGNYSNRGQGPYGGGYGNQGGSSGGGGYGNQGGGGGNYGGYNRR